MKLLFTTAAALAALALASGALAASPSPSGSFTVAADGPVAIAPLSAAQAKALGVPDAFLPGAKPLPGIAAGGLASTSAMGSCGLCINTCWTAVSPFRTGANTTTGSYWENDAPLWCGNGAWITYADTSKHWQTVSMWYSADGESGPWFDGGCVGCTSIHFTVYGYTTWHPPTLPASHTTLRLGVWLQAYGGASYG